MHLTPVTLAATHSCLLRPPDDELSTGGAGCLCCCGTGVLRIMVCGTWRGVRSTRRQRYVKRPQKIWAKCARDELQIAAAIRWASATCAGWIWPDGGVARIDREEAIAAVVKLLARSTSAGDADHLPTAAILILTISPCTGRLAAMVCTAEPGYRPDLGSAVESPEAVRALFRRAFSFQPGFCRISHLAGRRQLRFQHTGRRDHRGDGCLRSEKRGRLGDVTKPAQSGGHVQPGLRRCSDAFVSAITCGCWLTGWLPHRAAEPTCSPAWDRMMIGKVALVDSGGLSAFLMAAVRARRLFDDLPALSASPAKPEFVELLRTLVDDAQDATAQLSSTAPAGSAACPGPRTLKLRPGQG